MDIVDWSPNAAIRPKQGFTQQIVEALGAIPPLDLFAKHEIPTRWHYRNNRRIPPLLAVAQHGWSISQSRWISKNKRQRERAEWSVRSGNGAGDAFMLGGHGYDNNLEAMQAIFIASGPAFQTGGRQLPLFDNLEVYALMCRVMQVSPAPHNGTQAFPATVLR